MPMPMTLRLDDELDAKLTELARRERMSKQQFVIKTLDEVVAASARRDRIGALADRAAADYPETLRRLGE